MKQEIVEITNNKIVNHIMITIDALEKSLYDNYLNGIPNLLIHDWHKPVGWIFPKGLHIEPKLTSLIGVKLLPENKDDFQKIAITYNNFLRNKNDEQCDPYIAQFKEILHQYSIQNASFIYSGCVACVKENILDKIFPSLAEQQVGNKDLIYLDDLLNKFNYLGQGVFQDKKSELAIFAHRYYRRNQSLLNNFHFSFIDQLVRLASNKDIAIKLKIDSNMIGFAPSFSIQGEREPIFGAKYNDDISQIKIGTTIHELNTNSELFFYGIKKTEFIWDEYLEQNQLKKKFEVEEIRDLNNPSLGINDEIFGNRYVHSIYNTENKTFEHFDGALKVYKDIEFLERTDNKEVNCDYYKLFRIDTKFVLNDTSIEFLKSNKIIDILPKLNKLKDKMFRNKEQFKTSIIDCGITEKKYQEIETILEKAASKNTEFPLSEWKTLITLYFQSNPLIPEYFGINQNNSEIKQNTIEYKILNYNISDEEGLRFYITYNEDKTEKYNKRIIINTDKVIIDNEEYILLEFPFIEIVKALKRNNEQITIPSNSKFIKYNDNLLNLPTILHKGDDNLLDIEKTFDAYRLIFPFISQDIISFSISWCIAEVLVSFSVLGKRKNIINWLNMNKTVPTKKEEFRVWANNLSIWLNNEYPDSNQNLKYFSAIKGDGILYIDRIKIPNEWIINIKENNGDLEYEIKIPKEHSNLLKLFENNYINSYYSFIIGKAICSQTKLNYFESKTSKYLDENVKVLINEAESLDFYLIKKDK